MNKIILFFVALLASVSCHAQEGLEFVADRPGATTSPDIAPKYKLFWETGLQYEHDCTDKSTENTLNYHNSLFRFGVSEYAELRLGIAASQSYPDHQDSYGGISSLTVGTKVKIFDGWRAVPKISLLGELLLPGGSNHKYLPQHVGANLHLLFNNDITSWFSLGYDAGVIWSGDTDEEQPSTFLGACFSFMPSERLGLFVEEYNTLNTTNQYMTELGGTYMVSSRVQIDAYIDMNLQHMDKYVNIGIGVVWRIN